jgi:hypothetical protein
MNATKYQWSQTKSSQRSSSPHNDGQGLMGASSGDLSSLGVDMKPSQDVNVFDGLVQQVRGTDNDGVLDLTSNPDSKKKDSMVRLKAGSRIPGQSEIVKYKKLSDLQIYPSLPEDTPSKLMTFSRLRSYLLQHREADSLKKTFNTFSLSSCLT